MWNRTWKTEAETYTETWLYINEIETEAGTETRRNRKWKRRPKVIRERRWKLNRYLVTEATPESEIGTETKTRVEAEMEFEFESEMELETETQPKLGIGNETEVGDRNGNRSYYYCTWSSLNEFCLALALAPAFPCSLRKLSQPQCRD